MPVSYTCAEAWVESVQAYDKLSRAIASSPRGSAEAFHYATLKEKMDDQAYGTTHRDTPKTPTFGDRCTYLPLVFHAQTLIRMSHTQHPFPLSAWSMLMWSLCLWMLCSV